VFENDLAATISDDLALVFSTLLKDPDAEQPANLRVVYKAMRKGLVAKLIADGNLDPEAEDDLLEEMQDLIEEHGGDTLAQDFVRSRVSAALEIVIQAALDGDAGVQVATLGELREAVAQGLVAHLVGMGEIDADEDETLAAEIQSLVDEHGEDTPVEDLLP